MSRKLDPKAPGAPVISFRLTETDLAYIRQQAYANHVTVSEYLRDLVHESKKRAGHEG